MVHVTSERVAAFLSRASICTTVVNLQNLKLNNLSEDYDDHNSTINLDKFIIINNNQLLL